MPTVWPMGRAESSFVGTETSAQLPPLGPSDVRLFFGRTPVHDVRTVFPELWGWVTEKERARYYRYMFESDRSAFLLGRGLLRYLVGHYSGRSPAEIVFDENAYGKLILRDAPGFSFNLSHCHEFVCIAISRGFEVGVDIELSDPKRAQLDIADQYFTAEECAYILAHDQPYRHHAFFRLWTLKEAFIKCVGMGLSIPLKSFQFQFLQEQVRVEFMSGSPHQGESGRWNFRSWQDWGYSMGLATCAEDDAPGAPSTSAFRIGPGLSLASIQHGF